MGSDDPKAAEAAYPTPEMIKAGADVLAGYDLSYPYPALREEVAAEIFRAMRKRLDIEQGVEANFSLVLAREEDVVR
jgi:hypothetical protein